MTKSLSQIVAALLLALGGCGGRIHPAAPAVPVATSVLPFVGTWTGTYGVAGQPPSGAVTIVVSPPPTPTTPGADLSGTVASTTAGAGTVQGSISTTPNLDDPALSPYTTISFHFPVVTMSSPESTEHQAVAKINASGHLVLTHIALQTSGEYLAPDDFDLAPVLAPTPG